MSELPEGARAWLGEARLPWARLGRWPTPVTSLELASAGRGAEQIWIKREDLSHPRYGGNKLRTLEVLLGDAAARGVTRVWATGAYGSNHAVATLCHAESAGLAAGALLFPQPYSETAAANLRACLALGAERGWPVLPILSVATLPLAMLRHWQRERRAGGRPWMMPPGGARPLGALGALSAAFELAAQLRAEEPPPPATIVLAAGSTCTAAGLLAGLALAQRLGVWPGERPRLRAVRVTPWPVTAHARIAGLAARAVALADQLRGAASGIDKAELGAHLVVDGAQLGRGYGRSTSAGAAAMARFAAAIGPGAGPDAGPDAGPGAGPDAGPALDSVYSAKAAAALLAALDAGDGARGPLLLWSTKSAAMPQATALDRPPMPRPFARWLARGYADEPAPAARA